MKKKIKDLTLEEIKKYCDDRKDCEGCPFDSKYDTCFGSLIYRKCEDFLDQEIEVEEDV